MIWYGSLSVKCKAVFVPIVLHQSTCVYTHTCYAMIKVQSSATAQVDHK